MAKVQEEVIDQQEKDQQEKDGAKEDTPICEFSELTKKRLENMRLTWNEMTTRFDELLEAQYENPTCQISDDQEDDQEDGQDSDIDSRINVRIVGKITIRTWNKDKFKDFVCHVTGILPVDYINVTDSYYCEGFCKEHESKVQDNWCVSCFGRPKEVINVIEHIDLSYPHDQKTGANGQKTGAKGFVINHLKEYTLRVIEEGQFVVGSDYDQDVHFSHLFLSISDVKQKIVKFKKDLEMNETNTNAFQTKTKFYSFGRQLFDSAFKNDLREAYRLHEKMKSLNEETRMSSTDLVEKCKFELAHWYSLLEIEIEGNGFKSLEEIRSFVVEVRNRQLQDEISDLKKEFEHKNAEIERVLTSTR